MEKAWWCIADPPVSILKKTSKVPVSTHRQNMNNAYSSLHTWWEDVTNITDTNPKRKEKSNESKKCIFHELGPVASESLSRLAGQLASGLPAWGSWMSFTVCVMRAFRQSPGSHAIRLPIHPANTLYDHIHMPSTHRHTIDLFSFMHLIPKHPLLPSPDLHSKRRPKKKKKKLAVSLFHKARQAVYPCSSVRKNFGTSGVTHFKISIFSQEVKGCSSFLLPCCSDWRIQSSQNFLKIMCHSLFLHYFDYMLSGGSWIQTWRGCQL